MLKLTKLMTPILVLASMLTLSACTSFGPQPSEQIIGKWESSVGSFPLSITFAAETVQLGQSSPVQYALDGDQLTYENAGKQVRVVSFPDASTMQQLDPVTGTAHQFTRVSTDAESL